MNATGLMAHAYDRNTIKTPAHPLFKRIITMKHS